jgi:uncharacterized protein HemX
MDEKVIRIDDYEPTKKPVHESKPVKKEGGAKSGSLFPILLFLVVLGVMSGGYVLMTQQGDATVKKIDALKKEVADMGASAKGFDGQIKDLDAQTKGYSERIVKLEDRVNTGDAERKDISAKVADLMGSVEQLKKSKEAALPATVVPVPAAAAPPAQTEAVSPVPPAVTAETTPPPVDLGEIPVQQQNIQQNETP